MTPKISFFISIISFLHLSFPTTNVAYLRSVKQINVLDKYKNQLGPTEVACNKRKDQKAMQTHCLISTVFSKTRRAAQAYAPCGIIIIKTSTTTKKKQRQT